MQYYLLWIIFLLWVVIALQIYDIYLDKKVIAKSY